MAEKNRGFTHYQQTLFNKYEVDESYLQTRKQRRVCLELLEKVDKNQIADEKKLIGKIAAAFEGTKLYKRVASCVTIAALLVTLQGTPAMAGAVTVYQPAAVTTEMLNENTDSSVVMDDDSYLAGYVRKPQEAETVAVQPAKGIENINSSSILLANSVLMDEDSDTFKTYGLAGGENTDSDSITVTFEDPEKILQDGNGWINPVKYNAGGYTLIVSGMYDGVKIDSADDQPSDTFVRSTGNNINHGISFSREEIFDIDSISITNHSEDTLIFTFYGSDYDYYSYYGENLCSHEIETGEEKIIDFTSIDEADNICWLGIGTSLGTGNSWAFADISIDDITISNIIPLEPVVKDSIKYGIEDTVMNFTVSDFVYSDITGDALNQIDIVIPPDPAHGVLKIYDTVIEPNFTVDAENLDKITFTPAPNFNGSASFTYKGHDGTGYSRKPATITLVIAPVNDAPPVATDNNTWTIDENRVLLNGDLTGDVTDVDAGDAFTYERVTNTTSGDVVVNADGSFEYTPNTNFYGTDSFTWRVSDGTAWSNTATVTITVRKAVRDDSDDDDTPVPTPKPTPKPTPAPTPAPTGGTVVVNGMEHVVGTEIVNTEEGVTTVDLFVDNDVLEEIINQTVTAGQNADSDTHTGNTVELSVKTTNANRITTSLTAAMMQKLNDNDFALFVNTNDADYLIPADGINFDEVAKALGVDGESLEDITIEISIESADDEVLQEITGQADIHGYQIVFPPVRFTVTAKTKTADGSEREVDVSEFNQYVERIMRIPEGVDPAEITTGVVYNNDGTFSHVPTEVFEKDGVYYARIRSMTNSSYLVIYNPVIVPAVQNHWSREIVNDLASRLVIPKPESFMPDREITRGEFTEYIARAIGIFRTQSGKTAQFTDVFMGDEMSDAIALAADYGIINGFTDGTFKPDLRISREEAMAMYARAMDVIGLKETDSDKLEAYDDVDQVAQWAYESVKKVVGAGIFIGRTESTIDPKGTFTNAEAAAAIRNLLMAAGLINP